MSRLSVAVLGLLALSQAVRGHRAYDVQVLTDAALSNLERGAIVSNTPLDRQQITTLSNRFFIEYRLLSGQMQLDIEHALDRMQALLENLSADDPLGPAFDAALYQLHRIRHMMHMARCTDLQMGLIDHIIAICKNAKPNDHLLAFGRRLALRSILYGINISSYQVLDITRQRIIRNYEVSDGKFNPHDGNDKIMDLLFHLKIREALQAVIKQRADMAKSGVTDLVHLDQEIQDLKALLPAHPATKAPRMPFTTGPLGPVLPFTTGPFAPLGPVLPFTTGPVAYTMAPRPSGPARSLPDQWTGAPRLHRPSGPARTYPDQWTGAPRLPEDPDVLAPRDADEPDEIPYDIELHSAKKFL